MSAAALMKVLGTATVLSFALAACGDDDPVAPSPSASVYLVHGVNGADLNLVAALPVDVRAGTQCIATNLTFGEISNALAIPVGTYNIEVRLADAQAACAGTVVGTATNQQLNENQSVSFVAHLNAAGQPTLTRFNNDRTTAQGARVVARHTAAHGAVDVLLNNEPAFEGLTNGDEESAVLTPATYNVAVTPAGQTNRYFEANVPIQSGVVYIAYAVGTPANNTFTVLVQQLTMQ